MADKKRSRMAAVGRKTDPTPEDLYFARALYWLTVGGLALFAMATEHQRRLDRSRAGRALPRRRGKGQDEQAPAAVPAARKADRPFKARKKADSTIRRRV